MSFSLLGRFQEGNGQMSRALIIVAREQLRGEPWQETLLLQVLQSLSLHGSPEDQIRSLTWLEAAIAKIRQELEHQAAEEAARKGGAPNG